jgi:hypothetical protein
MRLVIGRPRSWLRRLLAWLRPPLPPPAWCVRCGAIREGDPNIRRIYGSRSHSECSGTYSFTVREGVVLELCARYRTYSA